MPGTPPLSKQDNPGLRNGRKSREYQEKMKKKQRTSERCRCFPNKAMGGFLGTSDGQVRLPPEEEANEKIKFKVWADRFVQGRDMTFAHHGIFE